MKVIDIVNDSTVLSAYEDEQYSHTLLTDSNDTLLNVITTHEATDNYGMEWRDFHGEGFDVLLLKGDLTLNTIQTIDADWDEPHVLNRDLTSGVLRTVAVPPQCWVRVPEHLDVSLAWGKDTTFLTTGDSPMRECDVAAEDIYAGQKPALMRLLEEYDKINN